MPTPDAMAAAVRDYARRFSAGDRAGWLGLFVDQPTIIEPADAPPRGREALEQSFDGTVSAGLRVALTPLRVIANGRDAVMHMQVNLTFPDGRVTESSVIEIFSFADDGRIAAMRAFIQPDEKDHHEA